MRGEIPSERKHSVTGQDYTGSLAAFKALIAQAEKEIEE